MVKTKIFMTNGSLMKAESIAECSLWSILQYFWPAWSDYWSWNQFLVFLRVVVLHRFYCIKLSLFTYRAKELMEKKKEEKAKADFEVNLTFYIYVAINVLKFWTLFSLFSQIK